MDGPSSNVSILVVNLDNGVTRSFNMKSNVNRRKWNNENSLSVEQENHEYNQLARKEASEHDAKCARARENKYVLAPFPVGTHTRSTYHA